MYKFVPLSGDNYFFRSPLKVRASRCLCGELASGLANVISANLTPLKQTGIAFTENPHEVPIHFDSPYRLLNVSVEAP